MSKHETNLDFSFLSTEEVSAIQDVLERDKLLKKCEEDRVQKIQDNGWRDQRWLKGVSGQWFQEIQQSKRSNGTNSRHHTQLSLAPRGTPLSSGRLLRKPGDRRENHGKAVSPSRASFRSKVTSLLAFRFLQKGSASRRSQDSSLSCTGASGRSSGAGDQDYSGVHLTEQGPHPDLTNNSLSVQQQEDSEGATNHRPSGHHVEPRKPETRPGQRRACYTSVPEEPRKPILRDQIDLCVAHKRGGYHNSLTDSLGEPPVTDSPGEPPVTDSLRQPHVTDSPGEPPVTDSLRQPHVTDSPREPPVTDSLRQPHVTDSPGEPPVTDLLKVSIITDSLGESTITDSLGESTSIKFLRESTFAESLGESTSRDLLRESTGTDLIKDSAVFLQNQPACGIAFHTEQASDCQWNSDLPKSNLVHLPIVASFSGLKRSNSLPTILLQSDETAHSEFPAHLSPLATMLPPSLVTVVAPHWTGRLRRPKQGSETTQAVKEANGRSQEVRRNSYVFKEQQTLRHRNSVSQSFQDRKTVQDKVIFHEPDTPQRQPATESAQGLVGWFPDRTTSRIPLSASVSLDTSTKISTGSSSSLVRPGNGHCSSLDVHHYRKISEVSRQQPPVARFKGYSSPSSILLSLRGGGSALGSPGTLSSSIYATTPCSKSSREGQLQYTQGDGSDRPYFMKSQTLPRRSTLLWRNHNQKDTAGLDLYDRGSLGYPLSHHTLPGPADAQNHPEQNPESLSATINLENNQKSSNAHNIFTLPRNGSLWSPDTKKVLPSYTVSNPTYPSSFSFHDLPTSKNSLSNMPNQSDKLQTPSQMFNSRNRKNTISFAQSKDISPKEGVVPTHTLKEHYSTTTLSPTAVTSPTTPERSYHFTEGPMTLCPTGKTNPTTLEKTPNSVDSSEIHRVLVVRIPAPPRRCSGNVDQSPPPRCMAVTSHATPGKSSQFVDNSVTRTIRAVIRPVHSTGAFQDTDHPVALISPDVTSATRSARSSSTIDNSNIHSSTVMNSPSCPSLLTTNNSKTHSLKAVTSPTSPRRSSHSVDNSIFQSPGAVPRSSSPAVSHQDVNSSMSHNPLFQTTSVLPTEMPQNIDDKKIESLTTTSPSAFSRPFNFLDSTNVRTHSPVSPANLTRLPQSNLSPVEIPVNSLLSLRSSLTNASIQNPTSQNNSNLSKESHNSINNTKILSSSGAQTVITVNKPSDVESSKTDSSIASSSPILSEIPPVKVRNSRIPSLEGFSYSTASLLSCKSEGDSLSHSGDTTCSPSPLSCPVLQTRSVCSVGALKTYSSQRQYSPPRVVSPTQKFPDPQLRESPLSPTENSRLASWRQHHFHSRHPAQSSTKDTHSEAAQRLSSETSYLDTTGSGCSQPLSPLPDSKRMFSSESVVDISTYSQGSFDLSENVKFSSPGLQKKTLNVNVIEVSDNIVNPNTNSAENLQNADSAGSGLFGREQAKNPVLRKRPTGIVVSIDEVWYQSADLRTKDETAPEEPLRDHRFVSIQEQNSLKSLVTLTSKKDHTNPVSPVVAKEFYFTECETIEVKENQGMNNSDVMANGTKMSFSSKQLEDELQTSRKKSRVEMPRQNKTSSSVSSTGKEDVSRVLKPSNHKNIIEREVAGFHLDYSQASWLTEENNKSKNVSEKDSISSSSNSLFDKSRNSSFQSSPCSPVNSQSVSVERYTLVPGPRRSSLSLRSSQLSFDFDSDDADIENVFYRGSLERKSKRKKTISFSELNDYQVCVGGQVGAADRTGNTSLSRSLKDISQESQSHPFSDFSLKAGRSFSVSNVHASRPSGSARMATVPRMTSNDSLRGADILDVVPRQRSRAQSCSIDQAVYGDESGKQVTTGRNRSPASLHKPSSVQADELSPSPPPSPLFSPPRMSRPPNSSPRSSLTSPDNLSPRGCLPSRGYKSSLSDLGESDSDTTTDDEFYLNVDKDEKETEL